VKYSEFSGVQPSGRRIGTDNELTITLDCIRKSGRRETTKLRHHTLSEARELAQWVLHVGNDIYTAVDICNEDGTLETIQNPSAVVYPSEVLLVEDNAGDALLVGQALAGLSMPVHLRIARDGEEALQMMGEPYFKPDLVILDLNIPKVTGFGVLASQPAKKTPVVVFTASENEADADRAFTLGAKDVIHKPMDLDDYKTAVSRMILKWVPREETGAALS
jgi:CheY-like chemotaxis protein